VEKVLRLRLGIVSIPRFQGTQINPIIAESSINQQDFQLVSAIFESLEKCYGGNGLDFLAFEVLRNRYYLSEMAGRDVGSDLAFDAYVKLFGSFMADVLQGYKQQVMESAKKLIKNPSAETPQ